MATATAAIPMQTAADPATDYARSVIDGDIVAPMPVRLACERHLRDLRNPDFVWDTEEVRRRLVMCRTLRHYKGPFKGRPFEPTPWQCFVIGSVFGWKLKRNGLRRFRKAFVMVPRKNGKTYLAASIAIMGLVSGGQLQRDGRFSKEPGAEVYFVATKEDQAKIGWTDCARIVKRSPGFSAMLKVRVKEIRYEDQDSFCKPLGADSDSLDGLNPSCAIKDEFHAWKDRALNEVIDDAYGAREQPLDFIITTEGTLRDGVHDDTVAHLDNILRQAVSDESFFGIMWRPDDGDDVFDERVWAKVNPNLGVSKSLEYMRERAARARMIPRELATFRTKQLNQRVNAAVQWIDIQQWDAGKEAIDVTKLRAMPCYAGLDLARKNDMSALALVFGTAGGTIDVLFRYWMPEEGLRDRGYRDRAPYVEWAKAGILTVTEGNVTDFRQIEADIAELHAQYDIRSLRYDPMHATDLALRLRDDHGIAVEEFLQTYRNYTPACSELDRLLAGAKIRHGGNPIARWNAKNATQRMGPSGNVMPCKLTSTGRIDGISALCMGIGSLVFSAPSANVGIDFF